MMVPNSRRPEITFAKDFIIQYQAICFPVLQIKSFLSPEYAVLIVMQASFTT